MNVTLSDKQHMLLDPMEYTAYRPSEDEFFNKALNKRIKNLQKEKYKRWQTKNPGKTFYEFLLTLIDSRNQVYVSKIKLEKDPRFGVMLRGSGSGALSYSGGLEAKKELARRKAEFKSNAVIERHKKIRKEIEKEGEQTERDLVIRKPEVVKLLRNYINTTASGDRNYKDIKTEIIEELENNPETLSWQTKEKEKLVNELADVEIELEDAKAQGDTMMVKPLGTLVGGLRRSINNIDFQGIYPQEKAMVTDCLRYHDGKMIYDDAYNYAYNFGFRMSRKRSPKRKASRKPKRSNKLTVKGLRKLASQHKIKGRSKMNKAQLMKALSKVKSRKKSKPRKSSKRYSFKTKKKHRRTPKKKKTFFKKYDLYSDANPKDTINISYDTIKNTKATIKNLEKLRKSGKYSHARIVQVANVLTQRLRVINDNTKSPAKTRYKLAKSYFERLKKDTKIRSR